MSWVQTPISPFFFALAKFIIIYEHFILEIWCILIIESIYFLFELVRIQILYALFFIYVIITYQIQEETTLIFD